MQFRAQHGIVIDEEHEQNIVKRASYLAELVLPSMMLLQHAIGHECIAISAMLLIAFRGTDRMSLL